MAKLWQSKAPGAVLSNRECCAEANASDSACDDVCHSGETQGRPGASAVTHVAYLYQSGAAAGLVAPPHHRPELLGAFVADHWCVPSPFGLALRSEAACMPHQLLSMHCGTPPAMAGQASQEVQALSEAASRVRHEGKMWLDSAENQTGLPLAVLQGVVAGPLGHIQRDYTASDGGRGGSQPFAYLRKNVSRSKSYRSSQWKHKVSGVRHRQPLAVAAPCHDALAGNTSEREAWLQAAGYFDGSRFQLRGKADNPQGLATAAKLMEQDAGHAFSTGRLLPAMSHVRKAFLAWLALAYPEQLELCQKVIAAQKQRFAASPAWKHRALDSQVRYSFL
jgi:hypothetical protein